jgi:hypothetical protein
MSSVFTAIESYEKFEGYSLQIPSILSSYVKLNNIIHKQCGKPEIDTNALHYAENRLPLNITETFVINLSRSLPPFLAAELKKSTTDFVTTGMSFIGSDSPSDHGNVTFIPSVNRRRCAWRIGDKGHTLILMRDGFTDMLDFITCFCIHLVETRKIRLRLQSMMSPSAADTLLEASRVIAELDSDEEVEKMQLQTLSRLPLTTMERDGIHAMWPHSAIRKLYNIIMHQEQYIVRVDTSLSKRFTGDSFMQWSLTVRHHIQRRLGICSVDTLPPCVYIDIVNSRNRSIKNLLCSLASTHKEEINAFADKKKDFVARLRKATDNADDIAYFLLYQMLNEDYDLVEEYRTILRSSGIVFFEDRHSSGLQIDLIEVSQLSENMMDPVLRPAFQALRSRDPSGTHRFIINIDYTFGAQCEGILRSLFLTFGRNLRSVNIVGKCAGIVGSRGDVLIPPRLLFSKAAFGEDTTDEVRPCFNHDIDLERLGTIIQPGRRIHQKTCITIPGMVLQNELLLRFYKEVYDCGGMEMEGSYIARQIEEFINLDLIRSDIRTRYTFYMSDMPLGNEDGRLIDVKTKGLESVTSMYALLREVLLHVLN